MTANKKLDVDEVISIFRESLNYHYLYDDQMNSAACENLITLCKQLREENEGLEKSLSILCNAKPHKRSYDEGRADENETWRCGGYR